MRRHPPPAVPDEGSARAGLSEAGGPVEGAAKIHLRFWLRPVDTLNMDANKPESGTLLELATKLEGDEDQMREALLNGYMLTGNFKGHEAEMVEAR